MNAPKEKLSLFIAVVALTTTAAHPAEATVLDCGNADTSVEIGTGLALSIGTVVTSIGTGFTLGQSPAWAWTGLGFGAATLGVGALGLGLTLGSAGGCGPDGEQLALNATVATIGLVGTGLSIVSLLLFHDRAARLTIVPHVDEDGEAGVVFAGRF